MIKCLFMFLFLYLAYGVYLAFDWIKCETTKFGIFELVVTLFCAIGVALIGPGWLFIRVFLNSKGE